ncbi:MAG: YdcF family protein [Candidatus Binatia bacterium]
MLKGTLQWIRSVFAVLGGLVMVVVTTPLTEYLAQPLRLKAQLRPAQAIVVLGGGAFKDNLPSPSSVARAVHGFSLLRAGYAPRILLSGGRVTPELGQEGLAMKKLLEDIGAKDRLLKTENRSTRTYSSAQESARILQPQGVNRILLVSHPNHMLRAKWTFERAGFTVYPAPIPWDRLPQKFSIGRICLFRNVLNEYGGLVLYWWRGWLSLPSVT